MGIGDGYHRQQRMPWSEIASGIKSSVSCEEAAVFYLGSRPLQHRIACPFHNGKDRNLSLFKDRYRCFVCGASGDVVDFVQQYFSLATRVDAMNKLNADFRLNLPISGEVSEADSKVYTERQKTRQRHKNKQILREAYLQVLWDMWVEMDKIKRAGPEANEDAYVYAVTHIDGISEDIDQVFGMLQRMEEGEQNL